MGERLQKARRAKGLSQPQLAAAAGVPVGSLRQWEQGRREPLLSAAARVASALGISLDALAGVVPAAGKARGNRGKQEG
jgi:transcriptional regulator with XRE-family HTH domain